jgi:hypothetical protein
VKELVASATAEIGINRRYATSLVVVAIPAFNRRAKVTPTLRVGLCSRQTINKP